ncbi:hypothetical protein MMC20_003799 [Loxospora ochrophaea]|nr:hypothetical protein [Loxospora ochrophaea]
MGWPYHFSSQTPDRRALLDRYANIAQLSALIFVFAIRLFYVLRYSFNKLVQNGSSVKGHSKARRSDFRPAGKWSLLAISRRLSWWIDGEVAQGYGTWREWLLATAWAGWLLILTVKDTGDDYLHLTKRFAIVGASQLPFHYLLACKSQWSPIHYLTSLSHEELNPYHRLLGRILTTFFAFHATLYLNFYVQASLLAKRIRDRDVILGLTAIISFLLLFTTALSAVRRYSYRLFFTLHVLLSLAVLPVLYFHVSHIRIYILESAAVYIYLILQRNISQTSVHAATINLVPNTTLLSISLPLPSNSRLSSPAPGQHIYLSLPTTITQPLNKLRLNPFTIASHTISKNSNTPTTTTTLTLTIRLLTGTTSLLSRLPSPTALHIEGIYGSSSHFPAFLATYDRILLIAGGVGATYTIPLYHHLTAQASQTPNPLSARQKLRFLWTVRSQAEVGWGLHLLAEQDSPSQPHDDDDDGPSLDNIQIHITHSPPPRRDSNASSIELQERTGLLDSTSASDLPSPPASDGDPPSKKHPIIRQGRPDWRTVVDEVFSAKEVQRVAVLVCGPGGMGRAVRKEVGRWVGGGKDVWWHDEQFGW